MLSIKYPAEAEIKVLANEIRSKLGDKLYNTEGTENRPVGRIN